MTRYSPGHARMPRYGGCVLLVALIGTPALTQQGNLMLNPGFEFSVAATVDAEGLFSGWRVGEPGEIPEGWTLNPAYTGELAISTDAPHSGGQCARITAPQGGHSHLYQVCAGLQAGQWYEVSVWVRGGPVMGHFYEYYEDAPIGGQSVLHGTSAGTSWPPSETWLVAEVRGILPARRRWLPPKRPGPVREQRDVGGHR